MKCFNTVTINPHISISSCSFKERGARNALDQLSPVSYSHVIVPVFAISTYIPKVTPECKCSNDLISVVCGYHGVFPCDVFRIKGSVE